MGLCIFVINVLSSQGIIFHKEICFFQGKSKYSCCAQILLAVTFLDHNLFACTHRIIILCVGVVEVVVVDCWVVVVLADATLVTVVDVGDVIPTEPLFCLLSLAQHFGFVCTVCHSGFALIFLFFFLQMWLSQLSEISHLQYFQQVKSSNRLWLTSSVPVLSSPVKSEENTR